MALAFLGCLAAQGTIFLIFIGEDMHGNRYFNLPEHPLRAGLICIVFALTTLFLFVASPFLFRRLGVSAYIAFFLSLAAFICFAAGLVSLVWESVAVS